MKLLTTNTNNPIDIHILNEHAFILACSNGHIEVVKYLIGITKDTDNPINIHSKNEQEFILTCEKGHIEVVKYLVELCPDIYSVFIKNNRLISYKTINPITVVVANYKEVDY